MDFQLAQVILVQILIGIVAVVFGVVTGRAKAERLRGLGRDLKAGRPLGYAIIGLVALVSIAAMAGLLR